MSKTWKFPFSFLYFSNINLISDCRLKSRQAVLSSLGRYTSIFGHFIEGRVCVLQEGVWSVKLRQGSILHHQDSITVQNGLDPVSNGEDGALVKLLPKHK